MRWLPGYCYGLIIFFSIWLFMTAGCAALYGYSVEPVRPDMETGTTFENVPVDFWQLPPVIMLLFLALPLAVLIGFPVELLIFLKIFTYLGYRKLSSATILHNDIRNRIFAIIRDNPGISFMVLSRLAGVNRGTLRYHLMTLRLTGKISLLDSGNPRYYEKTGMYSPMEKTVLKYLRNGTENRIFCALLENPDLTRYELGEILGLSPSTVRWRMNRLIAENLICTRTCKKSLCYTINPAAQEYLVKYLVLTRDAGVSSLPEQVSESV